MHKTVPGNIAAAAIGANSESQDTSSLNSIKMMRGLHLSSWELGGTLLTFILQVHFPVFSYFYLSKDVKSVILLSAPLQLSDIRPTDERPVMWLKTLGEVVREP